MCHTIYFADKAVTFTNVEPDASHYILRPEAGMRISRAKVLKIIETHNFVTIVSPEWKAVFAAFASDFVAVVAAGGIVVNECGEWLMIHRNGRWDLPKGHLEPCETLEQCAVREVAEETGVNCLGVVRWLCDTLHAYDLYGRWELKCTHWYELHVAGDVCLLPQTEEGIDRVVWCSPEQVVCNLENAYPTIRRVAESMQG